MRSKRETAPALEYGEARRSERCETHCLTAPDLDPSNRWLKSPSRPPRRCFIFPAPGPRGLGFGFLFSSLLFSGNGDVTVAALRCAAWRDVAMARAFADRPLWAENRGIVTPSSDCRSHPTAISASPKPGRCAFMYSTVTPAARPSEVCWSAHAQSQ